MFYFQGFSVEELWIKDEPIDGELTSIVTSTAMEESPKSLTIKSETTFDDYEIISSESYPLQLSTQLTRDESQLNRHNCDLCGVEFKLKVDLIIHLKDHQNGSVRIRNKNIVKGKYRKV